MLNKADEIVAIYIFVLAIYDVVNGVICSIFNRL